MILKKESVEKKENFNFLLSFFSMILFLCLISLRFDFYYDLNDDTAIRDILSGIYTGNPNANCIQMQALLSVILSTLYRIDRIFPWFGAFLLVAQSIALTCICKRMLDFLTRKRYKIATCILFWITVFCSLTYQIIYIQYTVTSGILMVAAIFLWTTEELLMKKKQLHKGNAVAVVAFIIGAYEIRSEMCLMLLPFFLLSMVCQIMEEDSEIVKKAIRYGKLLLVIILAIGISFSMTKLAYNTNEWRTFQSYFDDRTQLYDFLDIPAFEDNKDFYQQIRINQETHTLLENYNFSLSEEINADTLKKIVDYRKGQIGQNNSQPIYQYGPIYATKNIKEAIWEYSHRMLEQRGGLWYYLMLAGYLGVFLLAILQKKYLFFIKEIFLFAGRSVIWMYLIIRNRLPDRICIPLYLVEAIILLLFFIEEWQYERYFKKNTKRNVRFLEKGWILTLGIFSVFVVLLFGKSNIVQAIQEQSRREGILGDVYAIDGYCKEHPQNYYLLDVYSTVSFSEKIFEHVDNSFRNYDLCGGWIAKSPLMEEKIAHFDVISLEESLIEGEKVFFISRNDRDILWLKAYYKAKNIDIRIEQTGQIKGQDEFNIYRIVRESALNIEID